jgi:hypothetical protein
MQLRAARLCLDCEEIHEAQECPVCLSEAFVYLIRWVPVEERRTRRLPSAIKVTPEPRGAARWVRRGVVGLAVLAASRWRPGRGRRRFVPKTTSSITISSTLKDSLR